MSARRATIKILQGRTKEKEKQVAAIAKQFAAVLLLTQKSGRGNISIWDLHRKDEKDMLVAVREAKFETVE